MANNYTSLGTVYRLRGDLDGAEAMYNKSLKIDEDLGRKEGMASNYTNLGNVYQTHGDLDRAKEAWQTARALFEQIGMPHMVQKMDGWLASLDE